MSIVVAGRLGDVSSQLARSGGGTGGGMDAPQARPSPPHVASIASGKVVLNPLAGISLGNVAKHAATVATSGKIADREMKRLDSRRRRFGLQKGARMLVPHERVATCLRYLRSGETHVEVLHSPGERQAHYGSLEVCGSVWLCPVCATKVAEGRRSELVQAVQECKRQGGAVLHATFTARHKRGDDLGQLLEAFTRSYRRLTSQRGYKDLRQRFQLFGSVRALEVTHGEANGWHPHYHVLLFLSRPLKLSEIAELEASMRVLWSRSAALDGLTMDDHGLTLNPTGGAVADYVSKFGRDPELDPWGPESELTKAHIKQSRGEGSTPWDLLRRYTADGDGRAAHLFREYAGVFKGRQQLVWSPHLRALLGLEDVAADGDLAEQLPGDAAHLGWICFDDWKLVLRYDVRAEVLNIASLGEWSAVRAFLDELRALRLVELRQRGILLPDPPPPPRQLALVC